MDMLKKCCDAMMKSSLSCPLQAAGKSEKAYYREPIILYMCSRLQGRIQLLSKVGVHIE